MPVDHTKNIIELRNICFAYNHKPWVLKDINLDIHQGDYLGIIGPNGGGKTTLLKIILGLLKPSEGIVKLFGTDIQTFKDWYKIGYVAQKAVNFDANFPLTVEEAVAQGRYGKLGLFKILDKKDKTIIKKSLEEVEMWEFKNQIIGDLSGGQQQRVFIARALAAQPEVIFLDEPTAGVDEQTQKKFYHLLKKLNKDLDLTLVLISHDTGIIAHETTEMACVNKTLIYDANPKNFINIAFHNH